MNKYTLIRVGINRANRRYEYYLRHYSFSQLTAGLLRATWHNNAVPTLLGFWDGFTLPFASYRAYLRTNENRPNVRYRKFSRAVDRFAAATGNSRESAYWSLIRVVEDTDGLEYR